MKESLPMLMVDMRNTTARISLREIVNGGRRYVSNPIAFNSFVSGVKLTPDLLLEPAWQQSASASAKFPFFRSVMHEVLPRIYDVRQLYAMGGSFALRLTGVGDYTVTAINRRVVTLVGLPMDEATGKPVIDAEMRPDVFMSLCNDMLAQLAETTLSRITAAKAAVARGRDAR
jgi:hypothetical protein